MAAEFSRPVIPGTAGPILPPPAEGLLAGEPTAGEPTAEGAAASARNESSSETEPSFPPFPPGPWQMTTWRSYRPLGWPPSASFIYFYLLMFNMLNIYAFNAVGSPWTAVGAPGSLDFFLFWFDPISLGYSLLQGLMACNTLVLLYLWCTFGKQARSIPSHRLFYYSAALCLVALQTLYHRVALSEVPAHTAIPWYP